jgi:hypothetical protein
MTTDKFKKYRRTAVSELRSYEPGEDLTGISISDVDRAEGSPKPGDMIGRNPKNHSDQWLVAERYFKENLEEITE